MSADAKMSSFLSRTQVHRRTRAKDHSIHGAGNGTQMRRGRVSDAESRMASSR